VWHGRPARDPTGETPVPQASSRDAKIPIVSSTDAEACAFTGGTPVPRLFGQALTDKAGHMQDMLPPASFAGQDE
ncbi:MAG: hypothetical protein JXQ75_05370, partial [Phycisphaerae bacterium]|nr:hypothetical protein [Phycisphaerae bacterium]